MSKSRHHDRNQTGPGAPDGETGRRGLPGAPADNVYAVAAAAAVGASDVPAYARGARPDSREDMMAFLVLSAALTGIHVSNLAPEFSQADLTP